jgi:DNA replication protein DnaC
LIALHSFTPLFKGVARPWHAGLLYNRDLRLARHLLALLQQEAGFNIGELRVHPLDHIRFLLRLAELELIDRERRMVERRIKEARFPAVKSLDSFDFAALPSLNKILVLELTR